MIIPESSLVMMEPLSSTREARGAMVKRESMDLRLRNRKVKKEGVMEETLSADLRGREGNGEVVRRREVAAADSSITALEVVSATASVGQSEERPVLFLGFGGTLVC